MKILGIGNAIVDVICKVEDKFIIQNNLTKSTMKLVDETEFKKQQQSPAITERIRQDYEEGIRLGVRGTPTVFINGKKVRDRSMRQMETIIEKELQKLTEEGEKKAAE